jgi:poly(glycerol-phosphate) alpha-glucosyltransferase
MAARVVQLLRDPELVRRMSTAARAKAAAHGYDAFLADWARVLNATIANKPRRTKIEAVDLEVRRLTVGRRNDAPGRVAGGKRLRLDARLQLEGRGDPSLAEVSLAAVHEGSGLVVELPVSVKRDHANFRVRSSAPVSDLYRDGADARDRCRLRLRLTWANSSWQGWVTRPDSGTSGLEVGYGLDDEWTLSRR